MIQKFLTELSPREKKIFSVCLFILVLAIFDVLMVKPILGRLEGIKQETIKEEALISKDLRLLANKGRIEQENEAYNQYYLDQLPSDKEIISVFLKNVQALATRANVTLNKISPTDTKEDKTHKTYFAELECFGNLDDMVTFMHLVETSPELLKVVKFNLGVKKADSDEVKSSMTISKMVISNEPIKEQMASSENAKEKEPAKKTEK